VQLEELGKLRKSNDLIGNRSRDLPACSILPQPTVVASSFTKSPIFYTMEGRLKASSEIMVGIKEA
jgi:hypothetical protein